MELSSLLVFWYKKHGRILPWRSNSDAYKIWLSEIILQQTRVEQGLNYYLRFVESYPTVHDLAVAPLDDVLKLWQGLGYYTRARNLHETAKVIAERYGGSFPTDLHELRKLKGVGDYTAAAIASLAFKIPAAVVDGNVYRVLARYFGIITSIDSTVGKKKFQTLAQELIDAKEPDTYNQAIMDFGALVCTPQLPKCDGCPLVEKCYAFNQSTPSTFPVKNKKVKVTARYFHYLLLRYGDRTFVHQRQAKDIWHSLYEFPLITSKEDVALGEISQSYKWSAILEGTDPEIVSVSELIKHQLSHQTIFCKFYLIRLNGLSSVLETSYKAINVLDLEKISVPKLIENYIIKQNVRFFIRKGI